MPQRKAVHPLVTTHLYREELGGGGPEGSPSPNHNRPGLLSGAFENWALGPRPYSGKEWAGLAGKALALAELGLARRPYPPTQPGTGGSSSHPAEAESAEPAPPLTPSPAFLADLVA